MIHLTATLTQSFTPASLSTAVRAALGKPLRRAASLTQLAVVGALACLPKNSHHRPTALLWQSTSGPRAETLTLLENLAEPMPFDFLATQPAIAAAQLKPFLPGLESATYFPLDHAETADWSLLLCLAKNWLDEGRYAQVLCAHLDDNSGHWLALSDESAAPSLASLRSSLSESSETLADTPDFPARLASWLNHAGAPSLRLHTPAGFNPALEFVRS